ncbi:MULTISPECIES: encapsulin [unclassified Streptomyces]|uniref:encapsulin n=1 Tax=unclassified Streptomyces TaxID=2593676 RepID=UPI002DD99360|nr:MULTISPECIES: encapsulin [unclassified Streptomyces]WSC40827.1 encapsulin [Streptomyces sp. NBC_01763]WSC48958.1 encapsulin [Streptomyces sp. NBC_01762]WSC52066.1 encapsulin [Streptomyces sp. NBC_01761]
MTVGRGAWKRVVGRTWTAIVEPPGGIKRANWHVALNTIVDDDGFERKIVRESMTSGRAGRGEFGTYFIGDAQRDLRPWLPDRGSSGPVLDGSPIWTPALNGGIVLSTRGGDLELPLGPDVAIGCTGHDASASSCTSRRR